MTTITTPNPITGQPSANATTSEYSTVGVNPFATGKTGKRETVPFAITEGEASVTRHEEFDEDNKLIGYTLLHAECRCVQTVWSGNARCAGTYTAARVDWGFAYDSAAQNDPPALQVQAMVSSWLASFTVLVKSTMDSHFRTQLPCSGEGQLKTIETRTQSHTELIAEAK